MKSDNVAESLKQFLIKIREMNDDEFRKFIDNLNTNSFDDTGITIEEYLELKRQTNETK